MSEAMIAHGELDGLFRRWYENGALAEEVLMKRGQPDGLARSYFPSGAMKAQVRLAAGQVLAQKFWKDGEFYLPNVRDTTRSLHRPRSARTTRGQESTRDEFSHDGPDG